MPLPTCILGARQNPLRIRWDFDDGQPLDLTGATLTATITDQKTLVARNADGALTLVPTAALTVAGATREIPIVLNVVSHGLKDSTAVRVSSVGGNTGANGLWLTQLIDVDRFALRGSLGNGVYTSGGQVVGDVDTFTWDLGATDVGTLGNYIVTFKATYPGGKFARSMQATWQVIP